VKSRNLNPIPSRISETPHIFNPIPSRISETPGSLQPLLDSLSQAKAWGLQAPHHGTRSEPTRVKNHVDLVLSPMVQLHVAKARTNEIDMI
jgi:hypothetical protein